MNTPSESPEPPRGNEWHVSLGGKKLGPYDDEKMAELIRGGRLKAKSPVWKTGMDSWRPCGSIPEFIPHFSARSSLPVWMSQIGAIARWVAGGARSAKPKHVALVGIPLLLIAGAAVWRVYLHSPPQDDLLAVYASGAGEDREEACKIENPEGAYLLFEKNGSMWRPPVELRAMGGKEFEELFGEGWREMKPVGLVTSRGELAVLKVPPGWKTGEFVCKTGYFLMRSSGPIELAKVETRLLALPSLAPKVEESPAATKEPKPEAEATEAAEAESDPASASDAPGPTATPESTATPAPESPVSKEPTDGPKEPEVLGKSEPEAAEAPPAELAKAEPPSAPKPEKPPAKREKPKESELESVRREAREARERAARIEIPSGKTASTQYLQAGDQILRSSEQFEERGDAANALALARNALKYFEDAEATFRRTAEAYSSVARGSAAAPGPRAPTISGDPLVKTDYSVGETVQARIRLLGMNPRQSFVRKDSLRVQRSGRYVELVPPASKPIPAGEGATHTLNFEIEPDLPPGAYSLHSEIVDAVNPSRPIFAHDFQFTVAGAAGRGAEKKGGFLGKVGGVLEDLGVEVRVERK